MWKTCEKMFWKGTWKNMWKKRVLKIHLGNNAWISKMWKMWEIKFHMVSTCFTIFSFCSHWFQVHFENTCFHIFSHGVSRNFEKCEKCKNNVKKCVLNMHLENVEKSEKEFVHVFTFFRMCSHVFTFLKHIFSRCIFKTHCFHILFPMLNSNYNDPL